MCVVLVSAVTYHYLDRNPKHVSSPPWHYSLNRSSIAVQQSANCFILRDYDAETNTISHVYLMVDCEKSVDGGEAGVKTYLTTPF